MRRLGGRVITRNAGGARCEGPGCGQQARPVAGGVAALGVRRSPGHRWLSTVYSMAGILTGVKSA